MSEGSREGEKQGRKGGGGGVGGGGACVCVGGEGEVVANEEEGFQCFKGFPYHSR